MQTIPFDGLILSGGGIKGIGELGVLQYYNELNKLDVTKLKVCSATSIGTVISLLMLCGYTPMELFGTAYTLKNIIPIPGLFEMYEGIKSGGITSIDPLMDIVSSMVKEKLGYIPTSADLYNMGKTLVVSIGNVTKSRGEYISYRNRPDISVIDMVKMSCNLPFIFKKMKLDDDIIVDGGFTDNFPSDCVELKACKNILGVAVISKSTFGKDDSLFSYPYNIFMMCVMNSLTAKLKRLSDSNAMTLVTLHFNNGSILDFGVDSNKKMEMYTKGYEEARIEDTKEYLYIDGWTSDIDDEWVDF